MNMMQARSRLFYLALALLPLTISAARAVPSSKPPNAEIFQAKASAPSSNSLDLNEKGANAVARHQFDEAERLFGQALAADPGNITAVYNLASMYITNNKTADAISLLKQHTILEQEDAGLWMRLGDAQFSLKNIKEAISSYEKAYALDANLEGLLNKLATVYTLTNRLERAEQMFLKSIEQNPQDVTVLANLSALFVGQRKYQQAVSTAKKAIQLDSKPSTKIYITLGAAYEGLKDKENARIAYERARDLGDTSKELIEKLEMLKK